MTWKYKELAETLSGLYYRSADISAFLLQAGFSVGSFQLDGAANTIWTLALKKVESSDRIKDILVPALKEYPDNLILTNYLLTDSAGLHGVYAGREVDWKGKTAKKEFELITGKQSTLLPISFLEVGSLKALPVARIVTPGGLGTGFLISDKDLLLTNNHVINARPEGPSYKAQFNYQATPEGRPADYKEFAIDASIFHTSITEDWSIVHVSGNPAAKFGFLPLHETVIKKNDFVTIIQHPGGEYKKIALYHNVVTYCDDQVVQYLTDTMPGSSGSPVFNSAWDVVALHHSGGWVSEPGPGDPVLRNEGININRIRVAAEKLGLLR